MQFIRRDIRGRFFAVAVGLGAAAPTTVEAQQQAQPRKRPVIINDRSVYRPPPLPRDRNYVGPGAGRLAAHATHPAGGAARPATHSLAGFLAGKADACRNLTMS